MRQNYIFDIPLTHKKCCPLNKENRRLKGESSNELSDALNRLMSIIADEPANGTIRMDESVMGKILDRYVSRPNFIRLICGKQLLDAGLLTSAEHKNGEMSTAA